MRAEKPTAGMPYPVLDTTDKRILKVLGCGRPGQKSKPLSIRGLDGQFHELTDTHRELFRLLLRRSGARGCTWLRQAGDDSMASALGWCRRKVCRVYAELADMGLISGQRRGTRKRKPDEEGRGAVGWANQTFVLLHPLLATAGIGERCAAALTGPKIDNCGPSFRGVGSEDVEKHPGSGGLEEMKYAVIYEQTVTGYSAYVPDLPGCVAAGDTLEETVALMRGAVEMHVEGMREDGDPIPQPTTSG